MKSAAATARVAPQAAAGRSRRGVEQLVFGAIGLAVFVVAWEFAAQRGYLNPVIVSSPSQIAVSFLEQWRNGTILSDLSISMTEFAVGFILALVFGVTLGFAMGLNRIFEYAVDPYIWFFYCCPLIAFYPLIVVWLGFGFTTVVAITFLLSFVSIVINTLAGVQSIDPQLVRAVRAFGGNDHDVAMKLLLPGAVPHILAGVRIGLGRALHGVVLGEMFGSNDGLGFRLTYHAAQLQTSAVFVSLIILIVIGIIINEISGWLERRLLAWREF
jgi:NitT/TauT family transport system permease protein